MEDFVFGHLDKILASHPNMCKCQKCRIDVALLALNHLPPHYVCTNKGDVYTRLSLYEQKNEFDILIAIEDAAKIVEANPRHDDAKMA